jgi:3-oxoacyl-[acyl-carrier-protein] synthase III
MPNRIAAKISAVAGYVPPRVVTNSDIEKFVDTSDEWIRTRTGIRERHYADPGVAASHLGTEAARKALAARGVRPEDVDMIVVPTVTPDMMFPATACLIQHNLGATKAWGFDLSAACSGFVYGLTVGAQFVGSGAHKKVLVVGADVMTSILDFKDRATCVLFGDGAGAVLLEPAASESEGIIDFAHDVDGSGGCNLYMPAGGSLHPASAETVDKRMHFVHQEGQQVFKYAVRRMSELACHLLDRNGFSIRDLALVVPHQANLRIIRAMSTIPKSSSTSTASATPPPPPFPLAWSTRSSRSVSAKATSSSSSPSAQATPPAPSSSAGLTDFVLIRPRVVAFSS